jgi:endonuclease/exonuclease/phosphatase family metal-dependent hydrolase
MSTLRARTGKALVQILSITLLQGLAACTLDGGDLDSQAPDNLSEDHLGTGLSAVLPKPANTKLRIANYNVEHSHVFPLDNGSSSGAPRIDGFARIAKALNADIWAMQEVLYGPAEQAGRTDKGVRNYFQKITGVNWYMSHHTDYGQFLFSRYPIIASGSPERRVHWALIDVPSSVSSTNLLAFSVHFAPGNPDSDLKEAQAVATLVNTVVSGKHSQIPKDVTIVVTGDFNSTPNSPPYNAVKSAIGQSDLRPFHLATPAETSTHGAVKFTGGGKWTMSPGSIYDYMFYRSGQLVVQNDFVLNTAILSDTALRSYAIQRSDGASDPRNAINTSSSTVNMDHFPIIADFRLR